MQDDWIWMPLSPEGITNYITKFGATNNFESVNGIHAVRPGGLFTERVALFIITEKLFSILIFYQGQFDKKIKNLKQSPFNVLAYPEKDFLVIFSDKKVVHDNLNVLEVVLKNIDLGSVADYAKAFLDGSKSKPALTFDYNIKREAFEGKTPETVIDAERNKNTL